jgi:hypothetical protein
LTHPHFVCPNFNEFDHFFILVLLGAAAYARFEPIIFPFSFYRSSGDLAITKIVAAAVTGFNRGHFIFYT